MRVRKLSLLNDWPILHSFWCAKGFPPLDPSLLPATGLVAERADGVLLCGGFLVKSDTSLASLAFICGNPHIKKLERSQGLDAVILGLVDHAFKEGYQGVGMATHVPALQARYERLGFKLTDQNVKCYGGFL